MSDNPRLGFGPALDGYYDASLNLQMHVYRRSEEEFERWERHKDSLTTPEQVREWQARLRQLALAAVGGLPPGDTPLAPEVVGRLAGDGFDVEKVVFQSLPRVYVTANLYVPRGLAGPTGAVLFLCGHAEEAKTYPLYQAVCQRLARNGLVALAVDPLGQGERKSYLDAAGRELVRWGTAEHSYAGLQCWWLGHSVARYFVHDARRAVDYLLTRPEVDPVRIGITGNSGGGTQATWMMLLEPRLAAAAPGTFVTSRRDYLWTGQAQDAEQIVPGGTAAGLDHEDYLIAMAPRPVLVLAVDYDFFNVEGTVATVERARRVYRLLGHEDHIGLARARSTHEYHPDLARAATPARWTTPSPGRCRRRTSAAPGPARCSSTARTPGGSSTSTWTSGARCGPRGTCPAPPTRSPAPWRPGTGSRRRSTGTAGRVRSTRAGSPARPPTGPGRCAASGGPSGTCSAAGCSPSRPRGSTRACCWRSSTAARPTWRLGASGCSGAFGRARPCSRWTSAAPARSRPTR